MHLSDGVLALPTLAAATACAVAGLAVGLRRLTPQTLPRAALFAAVFFLIGTLHVPVGLGSVHLILNGLIGLLLGWLAFPVIFVALVLQALLFSFGGFATLGANTLLLAAPAVLAHQVLRPWLDRPQPAPQRLMVIGVLASTIGLVGATLLAALLLWTSGGEALLGLIALLALAQLPVWAIDAAVSASVLTMLARAMPAALTLR